MKNTILAISQNLKAAGPGILLFILITFKVIAQSAPGIEWNKSLGGTIDDIAYSVMQTYDGNYAVVGYTDSNNGNVTCACSNENYWIVKLDAAGSVIWAKCYGGSYLDKAYAAQQTADSGFVIAGESYSSDCSATENNGDQDFWIVKLNSAGILEWQKSYGGSSHDAAYSVQQTKDHGYFVAGYSYSQDSDLTFNYGGRDCWVIKLDSLGNLDWEKNFGGSFNEVTYSAVQTLDSGFIMAGYSASSDGNVQLNHGGEDYWVVKMDFAGGIEWEHSYGGTGDEEANSIQQTADGGYIVAGFTESTNGDVTGNLGASDWWILKLTSSGNIEWQKALGGTDKDKAFDIHQMNDYSYIVAGHSYSNDDNVSGNNGGEDYWVVRIDSFGEIIWQTSLGGTDNDYAKSVAVTNDDGFIVAGTSSSDDGDVTGHNFNKDYWVVKLSCNVIQTYFADADHDGYGDAAVTITSFACDPPTGYVVDSTDCDDLNPNINPGAPELQNGIDDNCNDTIDEFGVGISEVASNSSFTIIPNPAKDVVILQLVDAASAEHSAFTISILDLLGSVKLERISSLHNNILHEEISFPENFPQGMYYVKVSSAELQWIKPLIIQK